MRRQDVNSVRFRCLTSKLADDGHQVSIVQSGKNNGTLRNEQHQ